MSLQEIVNVTISKATASVSRQGFGTALIAAYHTVFPNRVRTYTDLDSLVTDGFTTSHPVYLAAQALLSQENRPLSFKVGRRGLPPTRTVRLTCAAKNATVYTVTVDGTAFSFTSDSDATAAEVATGLAAAINGGSVAVTATDNLDGTLDLAADVAGAHFTLEVSDDAREGLITQDDQTTDPGVATDLSAIDSEDSSWYGLIVADAHSKPQIEAVAAWVEARVKFYAFTSADDAILDPGSDTDVFSTLDALNYARTLPLFHPKGFEYGDAAWFGRILPLDPGSVTWAHKQLAGVSTVDLSASVRSAIVAKSGNDYTEVGGRGITRYGITPSGEYADVTRGIDWLRARLEERLFQLLVSNEKVPFTDAGIDLVRAQVEAVLQLGIANGFLAADPTPVVSFPLASDVSTADKAARSLPGGTFSATLAGAIHQITLRGSLAV